MKDWVSFLGRNWHI